ncbi:MAG: hypothetical protein GY909_13795 [Oligoflexia bacterium]|nr:hypothetical protein [Oligoflexia bacterium]
MKLLLIVIFITSCSFFNKTPRENFLSSRKLVYQLQNYPKKLQVKNFKNGVYVFDYSRDGTDARRWKKEEIEALKIKNNVILSYFSIGEAEQYRYYYKDLPKELIVRENPNWPGNYLVKYWDKRWQEVMVTGKDSYLSRIMSQGFDGVYLDIVDAFWLFKDKKLSAERMYTFIKAIRNKIGPEKILVVQNASSIIHYLKDKQAYFDLIDAIGAESTFFYGPKDMNNELKIQPYVIKNLVEFKKMGKKVFAIEYIDQDRLLKQFREVNSKYQFVPLATDRDLKGLFNQ